MKVYELKGEEVQTQEDPLQRHLKQMTAAIKTAVFHVKAALRNFLDSSIMF